MDCCGVFRLGRTPIELEILTQVKNKILHHDHLTAADTDDCHTTILTYPPASVRELNIPMYSNYIGSSNGKDVPDADILDIECDSWELVKEIPKPAFDSTLSPKSAACSYITRINKNPVIPPGGHELRQVMSVQSLK